MSQEHVLKTGELIQAVPASVVPTTEPCVLFLSAITVAIFTFFCATDNLAMRYSCRLAVIEASNMYSKKRFFGVVHYIGVTTTTEGDYNFLQTSACWWCADSCCRVYVEYQQYKSVIGSSCFV